MKKIEQSRIKEQVAVPGIEEVFAHSLEWGVSLLADLRKTAFINTGMTRRRGRKRSLALLGILVVLGFVLVFAFDYGMTRSTYFWEQLIMNDMSVQMEQPLMTGVLKSLDWTFGRVSESGRSFLQYTPTRVLLSIFGDRTFSLRVVPLLWSILTMFFAFNFFSRQAGYWAGILSLVVFATAPCFLFFAQHVSFLSATFCFVSLLFFLSVHIATVRRLSLLAGIFLAGSFYLGTLCYGPSRAIVLLLLVSLFLSRDNLCKFWKTRRSGHDLFFFIIIALLLLHMQRGTAENYLTGNSQLVFKMRMDPQMVRGMLREDFKENSLSQSIRFSLAMARSHLPALKMALDTSSELYRPLRKWNVLSNLPETPPYNPFMIPFILFGCIARLSRPLKLCRRWCILGVIVLSVGVLLTHRVDTIRLALLCVPLSILATLGMFALYKHSKGDGRIVAFLFLYLLLPLWYAVLPMFA